MATPRPTMMNEVMKPHYMCNKKECIEELTNMGAPFHRDLTVPELRVLVREKRKQLGLIKNNPGPNIMTEIKGAKKPELQATCASRNIPFTTKATIGELRLALRHYVVNNANGDTTLEIGKHAGATFQELLHNQPGYCEWAVKEVAKNEEASWQLIQFAKWVERVGQDPELWSENTVYMADDMQKSITSSMNRTGQTNQETKVETTQLKTNQDEMIGMMKAMMMEMHNMKSDMQEMKEQQEQASGSKNRKTSGTPSFEVIPQQPSETSPMKNPNA